MRRRATGRSRPRRRGPDRGSGSPELIACAPASAAAVVRPARSADRACRSTDPRARPGAPLLPVLRERFPPAWTHSSKQTLRDWSAGAGWRFKCARALTQAAGGLDARGLSRVGDGRRDELGDLFEGDCAEWLGESALEEIAQ